jgi:hypothetical protein
MAAAAEGCETAFKNYKKKIMSLTVVRGESRNRLGLLFLLSLLLVTIFARPLSGW